MSEENGSSSSSAAVKEEDQSHHQPLDPSNAEGKTSSEKSEDQSGNLDKSGSNTSSEQEAYIRLRKTLGELVAKKDSIDRMLEAIEDQLYTEEGVYLQEANAGNISKGFDQYTKTTQHRRKSVLTDQDRVFSQSSTSFDAEL